MTRDEIATAVRALLEIVLPDSAGGGNVIRASTGAWDSLKHAEIVFLVEDRFGVTFTEDEIVALDSLDSIVDSVETRVEP